MKRCCCILLLSIVATAIFAEIPTRYYVGKTEVSTSFWYQMPDSLDYITSEFNYDTLVIKSRELPLSHYIDSLSVPGKYILCKRSPEIIADLERAYALINTAKREQSLSASIGEEAPRISLVRYHDGKRTDNLILPGHCYLLSFWATWCGNCLAELKPEIIPSITNLFRDNPNFHFIPICIDSSSEDLQKFFSHEPGSRWSHLAEITYLDTDRNVNEQYGKSGIMPLNVVIGRDGRIRFIHSGAILDQKGLTELYDAIKSGL